MSGKVVGDFSGRFFYVNPIKPHGGHLKRLSEPWLNNKAEDHRGSEQRRKEEGKSGTSSLIQSQEAFQMEVEIR